MNFRQWQGFKQSPSMFGDNKNTPSGKYPKVVAVDEPATTPSEPTVGDLESTPTA